MDIDTQGSLVRRGIISYYAAATMEQATSMQSWVNLIEKKSGDDLTQHKITLFHKPMLHISGDPNIAVIGAPRLIDIAEQFDKNAS
ncbi:MAG: hypothetical protein MI924_13190 [Chloroflexales bacterium]|nr:hypothetical protein [Chloroflexales bacterium]